MVPRLPIPNRTVKRLSADDSADPCVKVGHRQTPHKQSPAQSSWALCFVAAKTASLVAAIQSPAFSGPAEPPAMRVAAACTTPLRPTLWPTAAIRLPFPVTPLPDGQARHDWPVASQWPQRCRLRHPRVPGHLVREELVPLVRHRDSVQNDSRGAEQGRRVLKPGALGIVLEFSKPKKFPVKQYYKFHSKYIIPFFGKLFSKDTRAYTYLPDSIQAFPEGKDFEAILTKVGYRNVRSKIVSGGIATIYIGDK